MDRSKSIGKRFDLKNAIKKILIRELQQNKLNKMDKKEAYSNQGLFKNCNFKE